jgi:hemolysin activation/secretion protein
LPNLTSRSRARSASIFQPHYPAIAFAAIAWFHSGLADAQSVPDAGSVRRQIEQQQRDSLPPPAAPQFVPPAILESLGGATTTVQRFLFAGNSLLTNDQLALSVTSFIGRPLDFAQLQNAAVAVATAYRSAGWVVRTYLPQQDITSGTVTIQIVEARFGAVLFEGDAKRVSTPQLKRLIGVRQAANEPVNAEDLERSLLLINDLPGVVAAGRLAPGDAQAATDLVLAVEDGPLVDGDLIADSAGARYTGSQRLIGRASLNNRAGFGDRADALLLHSEGSNYLRAGYSLPAGSRGWRIGANASHLEYDLVLSEFEALDARGSSSALGVEASYPLLRSRLRNLYLRVDGDKRRFDNESIDVTTTHYSVQAATVGLYGNRFDTFHGGGATDAGISVIQGRVDLSGSPNEAADAATTRTDGSFVKVLFSASRLQALTDRVSLFAKLDGQVADKNLDSSEKFYLGGSQGVRAYPEDEAGGTEGMIATLEARAGLGRGFSVTVFYDWGRIHVNEHNDFAGAPSPELERVVLKGAGVSVRWVARSGLDLRATVARRAGENPNPTIAGDDQDGSLERNRFWLQVSMPF